MNLGLGQLDPAELLIRADQVERELTSLEEQLTVPAAVSSLRDTLRDREPELVRTVEAARDEVIQNRGWSYRTDVRFELTLRLTELERRKVPVDRFRATVSAASDALATLSKEWKSVRVSLREAGASWELLGPVEQVIRRSHLVEVRLQRAQSAVALTTAQLEKMRAMLTEVIALTHDERPSLLRDFGHRGQSPFTTPLPTLHEIWSEMVRSHEHSLATALQFLVAFPGRLFLMFLIFVGLWLFARRGAARPAEERESLIEVGLIFQRPLASSLLAALLFGLVLVPIAPASISVVALTLGLVLAGVVMLADRSVERGTFVLGALILTLFMHLQVIFAELPALRRWLFAGEGVAVLYLARRMVNFQRRRWNAGWARLLVSVSRFWMFASGLGLVLWLFAFDVAVSVLIDGTASLMLVTVAFRVAYDVLTSFARSLVATEAAGASRMLRIKGPVVVDRFELLLRWTLFLVWTLLALRLYTVRQSVFDALQVLVERKLEVGSLSVTLGDVLALVVGFYLATYAARFTRFVLEEEVLPRTTFSLGSRAAVTAGAGYVVLGLGLFMALAAIGFELDKITILVSALGVGIGFGLQNIVQNFVAGLILIFGRPINVGDRVEVGGLVGSVTEVGFRASVIKTFQGAEVIVPNSQFVSDQVINWSLSDDHRRIELDVGAKYGTDPEQVLGLLLAAATEHPDVMKEPAPEALFMAFGGSSLDFQLRCWTEQGSTWMKVRSDLAVAINRKLADAGIEIPFPQQDLHLRSVDELAARRLNGLDLGRSGEAVDESFGGRARAVEQTRAVEEG